MAGPDIKGTVADFYEKRGLGPTKWDSIKSRLTDTKRWHCQPSANGAC